MEAYRRHCIYIHVGVGLLGPLQDTLLAWKTAPLLGDGGLKGLQGFTMHACRCRIHCRIAYMSLQRIASWLSLAKCKIEIQQCSKLALFAKKFVVR